MLLKLFSFLYLINVSFGEYNEKYRSQLHYSPPTGWMNDPNGLVYHNGIYHLFFQYWVKEVQDGPKKDWGHAVSKDLFHWETLPIALNLTPDGNMMFSGSAIIDTKNVTGFQSKDNKNQTMIAIFTAHKMPGAIESQWMAYSNDDGVKWKFYENNPIIANPQILNFRDPKVFVYGDHYVVALAAGNHVKLYNSTDLKYWTLLSEFGHNEGDHKYIWECTDLYPMNVTLNSGVIVRKWVLVVNTQPTTQYFVGSFDGHKFTNDNPKETVLWVEYGPDSYAGVTYNSAPNDRRIFISWMGSMTYVDSLPTSPWRGQMSLPRDMRLVALANDKTLLTSLPVPEIENLRFRSYTLVNKKLEANQTLNINNLTAISSNLLDIELTADLIHFGPKDRFGLEFSGVKDKLKVYFDGQFVIDRTNAGRHDFSDRFTLVNTAPRFIKDLNLQMRLILDTSSLELFADNGLTVMSSVFFSDDNLSKNITVFYESTDNDKFVHRVNIEQLTMHQLRRIWK